MRIFISYSWKDAKIVDQIDNYLKSIGIQIIRDKYDLEYKQNLKSFMRQIKETEHSLLIISDDYLRSKNCMYEMLEVYKSPDFDKKILPVTSNDIKIFNLEDRLSYLKYWEGRVNDIKPLVNEIELGNAKPIIDELREVSAIAQEIGEFLTYLSNHKLVTLSDAESSKYSEIIKFIGYEDNIIAQELIRIKSISNNETKDIELEKLVLKYPNSSLVAYSIAYFELTERKSFAKAILLWTNYMKKYNDYSYSTYINLGLSYANNGDFENALLNYNNALKLNATSHEAYINLALIHSNIKDYKNAEEYFLLGLKYEPGLASVNYNVGFLKLHYLSDIKGAEVYFLKALELDPSIMPIYSNLNVIYLDFYKDKNKAKEILLQAINHNNNHAQSLYNYATFCEIEEGDFKTAKEYYKKAIIANRDYVNPKLSLANIELKRHANIERALDLLEDSLILEPENPDVLLNLAICLHINKSDQYRINDLYKKAISIDSSCQNDHLDKLFEIRV